MRYNNYKKIKSVFEEDPNKEFQIKELTNITSLSYYTIKNTIKDLIKENFIEIDNEVAGWRKYRRKQR